MSKQGVWPSDANLKAIAEFVPPQTYMEIHAFLCLIDHYRQFIKCFTWIAQPLNEHLAREGASRKLEQVSLSEDALEAFQALKQACMRSPVLAFADYMKDFLLETDASKEGLGVVLPKNKQMGITTQLPMAAEHSQSMKRTIIPGAKMGHHRTF